MQNNFNSDTKNLEIRFFKKRIQNRKKIKTPMIQKLWKYSFILKFLVESLTSLGKDII
jgi:hypothetical protein